MYDKLKKVLVEEMSINPDDITMDAELINDLASIRLSLRIWSFCAKKNLISFSRIRIFLRF